ncbi:MAG: type II secretion system F family protein, partial [Thermoplasmata archaeon]|nr:type II secretion system F family protein [Thermoplasmata archaeon]
MSEEDSQPPGDLYLKLCKSMTKGIDRQQDILRSKEREREIRRLEVELAGDRQHLDSLSLSGDGAGKEFKRSSDMLAKKEQKLARLVRVQEQKGFRRALRITGMNLTVSETVSFASRSAALTFFLSLTLIITLWSFIGLPFVTGLVMSLVCLVALPFAVFAYVLNYPERLARNLELEAFGSAPDVVNYMVMSMELTPSLDRALQFAVENATGPMAKELKGLMWKVQSRSYATTEEALVDYAGELRDHNEEFRSALYNILSASKESSREGMSASLRRASDIVLTGTRQRVESFSSSLATPTTILFALGILLPMIIGSLLPMLSIGFMDLGLAGMESSSSDGGWLGTFVL